jgi:hypothetical protein
LLFCYFSHTIYYRYDTLAFLLNSACLSPTIYQYGFGKNSSSSSSSDINSDIFNFSSSSPLSSSTSSSISPSSSPSSSYSLFPFDNKSNFSSLSSYLYMPSSSSFPRVIVCDCCGNIVLSSVVRKLFPIGDDNNIDNITANDHLKYFRKPIVINAHMEKNALSHDICTRLLLSNKEVFFFN